MCRSFSNLKETIGFSTSPGVLHSFTRQLFHRQQGVLQLATSWSLSATGLGARALFKRWTAPRLKFVASQWKVSNFFIAAMECPEIHPSHCVYTAYMIFDYQWGKYGKSHGFLLGSHDFKGCLQIASGNLTWLWKLHEITMFIDKSSK